MISLNIDDKTIEKLSLLAAEQGMTLEGFLQSLAQQQSLVQQQSLAQQGTEAKMVMTSEELENELKPLLFHGPSLPSDFSRADIYADHD